MPNGLHLGMQPWMLPSILIIVSSFNCRLSQVTQDGERTPPCVAGLFDGHPTQSDADEDPDGQDASHLERRKERMCWFVTGSHCDHTRVPMVTWCTCYAMRMFRASATSPASHLPCLPKWSPASLLAYRSMIPGTGRPFHVGLKVAITMRYLASGDSYHSLMYLFYVPHKHHLTLGVGRVSGHLRWVWRGDHQQPIYSREGGRALPRPSPTGGTSTIAWEP